MLGTVLEVSCCDLNVVQVSFCPLVTAKTEEMGSSSLFFLCGWRVCQQTARQPVQVLTWLLPWKVCPSESVRVTAVFTQRLKVAALRPGFGWAVIHWIHWSHWTAWTWRLLKWSFMLIYMNRKCWIITFNNRICKKRIILTELQMLSISAPVKKLFVKRSTHLPRVRWDRRGETGETEEIKEEIKEEMNKMRVKNAPPLDSVQTHCCPPPPPPPPQADG